LVSVVLASQSGCGTAGDEGDSSVDALTSGAVTSSVVDALKIRNPQEQNKTWTVTTGNTLSGDWLMQVPVASTWGRSSLPAPPACNSSNCEPDLKLASCTADADCHGSPCAALDASKKSDADVAKHLCVGHSDVLLDEIWHTMTDAHSTLDITSLSAPRGRFLATMRNAITTLDRRGEAIQIRALFGDFPDNTPNLQQILADLTRDVRPGTKLTVSVGAHKHGLTSWNHSKIIAVDGKEVILGGMNMWGDHYLDADPVHDVSEHIVGPLAMAAQNFVNELWAMAPCADGRIAGNRGNGCPRPAGGNATAAGAGNVRMLGVGRLGIGQVNGFNRDPSDTALVAMMDAARSTIRISQQDIGSVKILNLFGQGGVLPKPYMDAWIRAAIRGVDVTVVVSNDNSFGGTGTSKADSYSNGWALQDLWNGLVDEARQLFPDHEADLCRHVHFAHLRSSGSATWADGRPQANHAKVVIIDDQAHYVGSQNLYDADLAEFGVIVDDQAATQKMIADYYSKLSDFSKVTTFRDASACR
jgi:phosphatidylserine/phosphatidylglycerophosphate/cardiolipin synthase-like enzyme